MTTTRFVGIATLVLASAAASPALAQREHQDLLHVDSGLLLAWQHDLNTFGFGGTAEPKIFLMDQVAVGLQIDAALLLGIGVRVGENDTDVATTMGVNVATLAEGEFYLGATGVRPFVGLGAGLYLMVVQSVAVSSGSGALPSVFQGVSRNFGIAPQIGIDFGGTRLAVTYNVVFDAYFEVQQSVGEPLRFSRNYLTLSLTWKTFGFTPEGI